MKPIFCAFVQIVILMIAKDHFLYVEFTFCIQATGGSQLLGQGCSTVESMESVVRAMVCLISTLTEIT